MRYTTTFVCGATLLLGGITDVHAQTGSEPPDTSDTADADVGGTGGTGAGGTGAGGTGAGGTGAGGTSADPHPSQFTIVDAYDYLHRNWYQFWDFPWQPADWTAPVSYYGGTTYLRYQIHDLLEPAMLQFCYFQDRHVSEKHACGPQWTFSKPGVYYRRIENRALWQRHVIDWTRELLDFMLIDNTSEGAARVDLTVDIIVVAEDERLEVPDDWQCPREWNCIGGIPPAEADPDDDPPVEEEPDPDDDPPVEAPDDEPQDDEPQDERDDDPPPPDPPMDPAPDDDPDLDSGSGGSGVPPEIDELDLDGPTRDSDANARASCTFRAPTPGVSGLGLIPPLALLAWRRRRNR